MSQLVDYVDELIQEVGPRPTGTQQEHQAAELIAERLDGFGLKVDIEEFPCVRYSGWVRALYYALCVIGVTVAIFLPLFRVIGVILVIAGAVLMALDMIGNNPLYSLFKNSLSQNVVARYIPAGLESSNRNRKVVVLANYDSARTMVHAAPPLASNFALLLRIIRVAMLALIALSLLLLIPFPAILLTALSLITGIVALVVLLAFLVEVVNFFMPYNQGANCNGSGVAVLYGLAQALTGDESARPRSGRGRSRRASSGETERNDEARSTRRARSKSESEPRSERASRRGRAARAAGAGESLAQTAQAAQIAQERLSKTQDSALTAEGIPVPADEIPPLQLGVEQAVRSVGDNLVNPFISQRPPLTEIEETNRQREEERERRLEEQRKRIGRAEGKVEDRVPAWYANAKKNAEKSAERKLQPSDGTEVVRSRFADVPTVGSAPRAEERPAEPDLGTTYLEEKDVEPDLGTVVVEEQGPEPEPYTTLAETLPTPIVVSRPRTTEDLPQASAGKWTAETTAAPATPATEWPAALSSAPAPAPAETTQEYGAVTAQPDFTGLDREAFRVLPDDANGNGPVIVPSQSDLDGGGEQRRLRNRLRDLPSLSAESTGGIPVQQAGLDTAPVTQEELFPQEDINSPISSTGAFIPLGTTGVMKPIGEELLNYTDEGELFVADADDTYTPGRYAGRGSSQTPDSVNIPESRMKSFLGSVGERLSGKKKEKLKDSPSSWLGVDEDYDARKEGRDIGSWDNFNGTDDEWNGGAYGGASFEDNVDSMMELSNELLDKEVWLVALGANESKNAGIKQLFANHGSELKSALFINLLGVGVGDLVFTISEGNFRPAQTDHRLQDLISRAAKSMAIPIAPIDFSAFATDCTETLSRGGRAISIMGLGKHLPIGWHWMNDDVSRLREDNLQDTTALVIETIKNS